MPQESRESSQESFKLEYPDFPPTGFPKTHQVLTGLWGAGMGDKVGCHALFSLLVGSACPHTRLNLRNIFLVLSYLLITGSQGVQGEGGPPKAALQEWLQGITRSRL